MQNRSDTPDEADGRFERLHRFHGGLVLPSHNEESTSLPITNVGIPPLLVLPLQQHIGDPAECLVKPGVRDRAVCNVTDSAGTGGMHGAADRTLARGNHLTLEYPAIH